MTDKLTPPSVPYDLEQAHADMAAGVEALSEEISAQAKEIEELRAENELIKRQLLQQMDLSEKRHAYAGKLREALVNISNPRGEDHEIDWSSKDCWETCLEIAREALALEMPGSNNNKQKEKS